MLVWYITNIRKQQPFRSNVFKAFIYKMIHAFFVCLKTILRTQNKVVWISTLLYFAKQTGEYKVNVKTRL